jgi:hypothetical protein
LLSFLSNKDFSRYYFSGNKISVKYFWFRCSCLFNPLTYGGGGGCLGPNFPEAKKSKNALMSKIWPHLYPSSKISTFWIYCILYFLQKHLSFLQIPFQKLLYRKWGPKILLPFVSKQL